MSTDKKPDGGPAFPIDVPDSTFDHQYQPGMTLRDYFAGQALAGIFAGNPKLDGRSEFTVGELPAYAYAAADAMIAERSKP